jgi:gamma-glutamylputrescine oxidase
MMRVHTVIIGGGFAGLNTALSLAEHGISALVLEEKSVGFGASGRNGGFVFAGYSLGEAALLKALGPTLARAWYQRTVEAVNTIRARIQRYGIDCDRIDAGVLWANWFDDDAVLRQRQTLLGEHFGASWHYLDRAATYEQLRTQRYHGALFERNAMHLNPLKLARGLARAATSLGARVLEGVTVNAIEAGARWQVHTAQGTVACEHVVMACGGYLSAKLAANQPRLRRALLPIATYVVATEPLGALLGTAVNTQAAVYDTRFAFDYYRATSDTRLIWGGRINIADAAPQQVAKMLRRDLQRVYPQLKDVRIAHAWSGLMSYARHEMPQIGQLQPGFWYAQAFGGHGLAPTCVAGSALADAIATGSNDYVELAPFDLSPTFGALGLAAAQLKYWWLQGNDRYHAR